MRTAYVKELTLDKEHTSYDNLLDGLRLLLKGYNIKKNRIVRIKIYLRNGVLYFVFRYA
jgi:hypothetical protein